MTATLIPKPVACGSCHASGAETLRRAHCVGSRSIGSVGSSPKNGSFGVNGYVPRPPGGGGGAVVEVLGDGLGLGDVVGVGLGDVVGVGLVVGSGSPAPMFTV
jgi:hypothetical protein